ncbi:MAG: sigma-70 family RNA polymerase sigma factor [Clostridiales bacterium]|nr:sigma-70 family RNA polymerase sigma factor [Clostridiales bacterium]
MKDKKKYKQEVKFIFTAWLKTLVKRARIDYLRQTEKEKNIVSLDRILEEKKPAYEMVFMPLKPDLEKGLYTFDNPKMDLAFSKLTLRRRQVLLMKFFKGMTTKEIAMYFQCSVQAVLEVEKKALDKLREYMED